MHTWESTLSSAASRQFRLATQDEVPSAIILIGRRDRYGIRHFIVESQTLMVLDRCLSASALGSIS